jgi:hypothetical protein
MCPNGATCLSTDCRFSELAPWWRNGRWIINIISTCKSIERVVMIFASYIVRVCVRCLTQTQQFFRNIMVRTS